MSAFAAFAWGLAIALGRATWDMRQRRIAQRKVDEGFAGLIRQSISDGRTDILLEVANALEDPTQRKGLKG